MWRMYAFWHVEMQRVEGVSAREVLERMFSTGLFMPDADFQGFGE